jgi:competence protein ComEA
MFSPLEGYPAECAASAVDRFSFLQPKKEKIMKKIIALLSLVVMALVFTGPAFSAPPPAKQLQKVENRINVNTATVKELTVLPGIGDKTAANIVSYRQGNPHFHAPGDLLKVKGVGKKTLKKIEHLITFE